MGLFESTGERLACRELEVEKIGGVPHYVVGQHHAWVLPVREEQGDMRLLTYVAANGHLVILIAIRSMGEWLPVKAWTSGYYHARRLTLRPGYSFSKPAIRAMEGATENYPDDVILVHDDA